MELKQSNAVVNHFFPILLIVPYGIETAWSSFSVGCGVGLLIVPYGIETLSQT